jgi:N-formylglutamate deformylase
MDTYRYQPGETPVLMCISHVGTAVPAEAAAAMTDAALALPDTDWDIDRLFHFAPALGVGFLKASVSRHVVDLNRDPADADGLPVCPFVTLGGTPVYRPGAEPGAGTIAERLDAYWQPFHERLDAALTTIRDRFGVAVLIDLHSIPSARIGADAWDVSLGTWDGATASPALADRMAAALEAAGSNLIEIDGPVRGGHVVRRYGRPQQGVHALTVVVNQDMYIEAEPERRYREDRATVLRPRLERMLGAAVEWAWERSNRRRAGGV